MTPSQALSSINKKFRKTPARIVLTAGEWEEIRKLLLPEPLPDIDDYYDDEIDSLVISRTYSAEPDWWGVDD